MAGCPTKNFNLLVDWFPRAGFRWRRAQGSPRILRSDARDAVVRRAIIEVHLGGNSSSSDGGRIRKREAQDLVVDSVATMARMINDAEQGICPGEDIIEFLERSAQFSDLSKAIPGDVWVELIFQAASARNKYERETPEAQKRGEADQLTALSSAIDALVSAAGTHWDWMALEMYAFPHLMGEAADYEVEEEGDDEETSPAGAGGKDIEDIEMADEDANGNNEVETELPRRMADLSVVDEDGDVQMAL